MNEARAFKKAGLTEESDTKIKKKGGYFFSFASRLGLCWTITDYSELNKRYRKISKMGLSDSEINQCRAKKPEGRGCCHKKGSCASPPQREVLKDTIAAFALIAMLTSAFFLFCHLSHLLTVKNKQKKRFTS